MAAELGKVQNLKVLRIKDFGYYLGTDENDEEAILLPIRQVPEGTEVGSVLEVFVYRDSQGRPIATIRRPLIVLGELRALEVRDVTKIGAFLDWGLEKDLFLPFKEQTEKLHKGDRPFVRLYIDKSSRLCASMRVYDCLKPCDIYTQGDQVEGTVYKVTPDVGVFVAVDDQFFGLIPGREVYDSYRVGDHVSARVTKVRPDGKLNLALRAPAWKQMDDDAVTLFDALMSAGGKLPLSDNSDPEKIREALKMSKNAFKRAAGRLLREGKIEMTESSILLKEKNGR